MKLQRTTVVLVVVAFLCASGVYVYEAVVAPRLQQAKTQAEKLFGFTEDQVQRLKVTTVERVLEMERVQPKKPDDPKWQLKQPEVGPGSDAAAAFLLSLMANGQSSESLQVRGDRQGEFGLDRPLATVEVVLKDGKQHRLVLGKPTFDNSKLYALVDASFQGGGETMVRLVSADFESAVLRSTPDWRFAAELPTPTPGSPLETPASPRVTPGSPGVTPGSPGVTPGVEATVETPLEAPVVTPLETPSVEATVETSPGVMPSP